MATRDAVTSISASDVKVLGSGFRVWGFGFRVSGLGFRALKLGLEGLGFTVWGLRAEGSEFSGYSTWILCFFSTQNP